MRLDLPEPLGPARTTTVPGLGAQVDGADDDAGRRTVTPRRAPGRRRRAGRGAVPVGRAVGRRVRRARRRRRRGRRTRRRRPRRRPRGVELRADLTERQEGLRGEQQHEQRRPRPSEPSTSRKPIDTATRATDRLAASSSAKPLTNDTRSTFIVCDAVLVGDRRDAAACRRCRPKTFSVDEPLDGVERTRRRGARGASTAVAAPLASPADQDHEERDEREGHERRSSPLSSPEADHDHDEHRRRDRGQDELREVPREVRVERVEPGPDGVASRRSSCAASHAGPAAATALEDARAQLLFTRAAARAARSPRAPRPTARSARSDRAAPSAGTKPPGRRRRGAPSTTADDGRCDHEPGERDDRAPSGRAPMTAPSREERRARRRVAQQSRIERLHRRVRLVRRGGDVRAG